MRQFTRQVPHRPPVRAAVSAPGIWELLIILSMMAGSLVIFIVPLVGFIRWVSKSNQQQAEIDALKVQVAELKAQRNREP